MELDEKLKSFARYYFERDIQQVENLLSSGELDAIPNFEFYKFLTFCRAVEAGTTEMVEIFLKYGVKVNSVTFPDLKTPLHLACEKGYYHIVELLLNSAADVNSLDGNLHQPLFYAVRGLDINVVKLLLQRGAICTAREVVKYKCLIENHYRFTNNFFNRLGIVELLIDYKIIQSKNFLVFEALMEQDSELLELLIKKGVNVNSRFEAEDERPMWTPLCTALAEARFAQQSQDLLEVVQTLLKNGANPCMQNADKMREIPLQLAQNVSVIKLLLKFGADINGQDAEGNTALHCCRNEEVMTYLISHGINVQIRNSENKTAEEVLETYRNDYYVCKHLLHYKKCVEEISNMKNIILNNYDLRLHDILLINSHNLSYYVNNVKLKRVLIDRKFFKKFPIFGRIVKEKCKLAETRKNIMDCASQSFEDLTGLKIPELHLMIFKYFSNDELDSGFCQA